MTSTARLGESTQNDETDVRSVRAAEYVRMSTEHQKYSTENQAEVIRQYAARRGIEVVRTYADEGKSGLRLDGRDALKQLIDDVQCKKADFATILVYDVSRWGRFQDADESAYYEYICKRAGISVQYCAEQFENDGSPVSTIVKGVKRAMAGEYSRELSVKVFTGQCRLIELGFRQGGPAGYGLRRTLVDQAGAVKGELVRGEHKSIQTDRVVLMPGPSEEKDTVRWIYRAFVEEGKLEREIAGILNESGTVTDLGRPWTRGTVHQVLINEKYIGNNVWNRASFKLKKKRVQNSPDMWVRADGAFEPIIERSLFEAAQALIRHRSYKLTNDEMLSILQRLLNERGYLSGLIIDEAERAPSSSSYQSRFGSLLRAYELVGFTPDRDYRYIEINRALRRMHSRVVADTIAGIEKAGGRVHQDPATDLLTINSEFTASIVVVRCRETMAGSLRWHIRFARRQHRAIDLLHDIQGMNRRGYSAAEITKKTGLTLEYVRGVLRLLGKGEHRLLRSVESGQIPISIAVQISDADDAEVQEILQQAYESKLLRGRKLITAKRLIEQRRRRGKGLRVNGQWHKRDRTLSSNSLIRAYKEDVDRKRLLIRKANSTRDQLIFVTEALRKLFADENFITLLRAEELDTIPQNLAERMTAGAQA